MTRSSIRSAGWEDLAGDELRRQEKFLDVLKRHDSGYEDVLIALSMGPHRPPEPAAALSLCRAYLSDLSETIPVLEYQPVAAMIRKSLEVAIAALAAEPSDRAAMEKEIDRALYQHVQAVALSGPAAAALAARFSGGLGPPT